MGDINFITLTKNVFYVIVIVMVIAGTVTTVLLFYFCAWSGYDEPVREWLKERRKRKRTLM